MSNHPFKPSELKFLWKRRGNQNYTFKHFVGVEGYPKFILFEDVSKKRDVLGKIVDTPAEGEAYHWARLQHENLLPLYDVVSINEKTCIFITPVLEKSLRDIIYEVSFIQDRKCFDRKKSYVEDVLWGLDYIHRRSLCLINLSDTKILICGITDRAVICDFSGLRQIQRVDKTKFTVPPAYGAPELEIDDDGDVFDPVATEMWGCGVMFMQIFTQHMLPWATSAADVCSLVSGSLWNLEMDAVRQANIGSELKSEDLIGLKQFLAEFLKVNPTERTSARNAATSEFLQRTDGRLDRKARDFWSTYDPEFYHIKPSTNLDPVVPKAHNDTIQQEFTNKFISLHYANPCPGSHRCINEDYAAIWDNSRFITAGVDKTSVTIDTSKTNLCQKGNNLADDRNVIVPAEKPLEDSKSGKEVSRFEVKRIDLDEHFSEIKSGDNDNSTPTKNISPDELLESAKGDASADAAYRREDMRSKDFECSNSEESEESSSSETLRPSIEESGSYVEDKRYENKAFDFDDAFAAGCPQARDFNFDKMFLKVKQSRWNTAKSESEVEFSHNFQTKTPSLRNRSLTGEELNSRSKSENQSDGDHGSLTKTFSTNFNDSVWTKFDDTVPSSSSPTAKINTPHNPFDINTASERRYLKHIGTSQNYGKSRSSNIDNSQVKPQEISHEASKCVKVSRMQSKDISSSKNQNAAFENKDSGGENSSQKATQGSSKSSRPNFLHVSFSTPDQTLLGSKKDGAKTPIKCSNCDKIRFLHEEDELFLASQQTSMWSQENEDMEKLEDNFFACDFYNERNYSYNCAVRNGLGDNSETDIEAHCGLSLDEMGDLWQLNSNIISQFRGVMKGDKNLAKEKANEDVAKKMKKVSKKTKKVDKKAKKVDKKMNAGKVMFSKCESKKKTIAVKLPTMSDPKIEVSMDIPLCSSEIAKNCLGQKIKRDEKEGKKKTVKWSWLRHFCPGSKTEKTADDERFEEIPLEQLR